MVVVAVVALHVLTLCTDRVQTACAHLFKLVRHPLRHASYRPHRALVRCQLCGLQSRLALPGEHRDVTGWIPLRLEHQPAYWGRYPTLQQQMREQHQSHDMDGQQAYHGRHETCQSLVSRRPKSCSTRHLENSSERHVCRWHEQASLWSQLLARGSPGCNLHECLPGSTKQSNSRL